MFSYMRAVCLLFSVSRCQPVDISEGIACSRDLVSSFLDLVRYTKLTILS